MNLILNLRMDCNCVENNQKIKKIQFCQNKIRNFVKNN